MVLRMGRKVPLPTTFADHTGMRKLQPGTGDPILSSGSLLVLDFGWDPDKSAALTDGRKFTNLADYQCQALTGGTEDDRKPFLQSVSFVPKTTPGTGDGVIEHTTKGALHVALRQAAPAVAAHGWKACVPEEVRQYMKDHPTNKYAVGLWSRNTRVFGSGAKVRIDRTNAGGLARNYLTVLNYDGIRNSPPAEVPPVVNKAVALVSPGSSASELSVGLKRHVLYADGWTGTAPDDANMFAFDSWLTFGINGALGTQGSWAAYRLWITDLTVSDRTRDELLTVDSAMYAKAFGEGGRFADDAWTDPATL